MKLIAVTMVRDEADIIGFTLRHLIHEGIDHIIVADNLSTDNTRAILDLFPSDRLTVVEDSEPAYNQDRKMSALALRAWQMGADWVLPFDADEWWYSHDLTIAAALDQLDRSVNVVEARGWDHMPIGSTTANPYLNFPYRLPEPQRLPKVAFRAHPDASLHYGNHGVNLPGGTVTADDRLFYRHVQWRSLEQATRKIRQGNAALEVANVHWNYGTHWRKLALLDDVELKEWWDALCDPANLVYDPVPM